MEFRILGPLEVRDSEGAISLGGPKQRAVLAVLLLGAGEGLSADRLIDAVWGEEAPATARKALQLYVSRLRRLLGRDRLLTEGGGYRLVVGRMELDVRRFEGLVEEGRS